MVMKPNGVSSAQFCRDMGWGVGQRLVGNEGYGDTTIEITAIGEESIFAKAIAGPGSSPIRESGWTLACRDWEPVKP